MPNKHRSGSTALKHKKRLDEATAEIVQGINFLLVKAQLEQLFTISSILEQARESITWWAVNDDYKESEFEALTQKLTLNNGLYTALLFLAKFSAINDISIRNELMQSIQQFELKSPVTSLPAKKKPN